MKSIFLSNEPKFLGMKTISLKDSPSARYAIPSKEREKNKCLQAQLYVYTGPERFPGRA